MSHLEFIEHDPPLKIDHFAGDITYQQFTVTWKGLDFLRFTYTEPDGTKSKKQVISFDDEDEDDEDEDDEDEDTEAADDTTFALPESSREYHVQCLMDNFKYYWGKASSLKEAKQFAAKAEEELRKFAYMIQTRRAS